MSKTKSGPSPNRAEKLPAKKLTDIAAGMVEHHGKDHFGLLMTPCVFAAGRRRRWFFIRAFRKRTRPIKRKGNRHEHRTLPWCNDVNGSGGGKILGSMKNRSRNVGAFPAQYQIVTIR